MSLMSTEEPRDAALALPDDQRAKLAKNLLWSLDGSPETNVDAAWIQEIERRARELADGSVESVDWETARKRIARVCKAFSHMMRANTRAAEGPCVLVGREPHATSYRRGEPSPPPEPESPPVPEPPPPPSPSRMRSSKRSWPLPASSPEVSAGCSSEGWA